MCATGSLIGVALICCTEPSALLKSPAAVVVMKHGVATAFCTLAATRAGIGVVAGAGTENGAGVGVEAEVSAGAGVEESAGAGAGITARAEDWAGAGVEAVAGTVAGTAAGTEDRVGAGAGVELRAGADSAETCAAAEAGTTARARAGGEAGAEGAAMRIKAGAGAMGAGAGSTETCAAAGAEATVWDGAGAVSATAAGSLDSCWLNTTATLASLLATLPTLFCEAMAFRLGPRRFGRPTLTEAAVRKEDVSAEGVGSTSDCTGLAWIRFRQLLLRCMLHAVLGRAQRA